MFLGCHLSVSQGYKAMGEEALRLGANTFAFFTRNPRGGKARALDEEDTQALVELLKENDFGPLVAHAPYTLNPASKTEKTVDFAYMAFEEDLKRMEYIPGNYYNFHPGSHVGQGSEKGVEMIIEMLNDTLWDNMQTTVLLEGMAGKGTEIGRNFEELAAIIDGVNLKDKIGVCLDTCHLHEAGYDVKNDLDGVLAEFDRIVGLDKLKALHLNDSKNPLGAGKDRHEKIGEGELGIDFFKEVVNHPYLSQLPLVLETPHDDNDGYGREIELLRGLVD